MLFAYNRWANGRLLSAVRSLSADEFTRDLGASFRSLKGTLVHILDGEWVWVQAFQGKPRTRRVEPDDFADAAAVAGAFPDLEREQSAFLGGLTEEQLAAGCKARDREYPLAQLVQHALDHSIYHRGQVALLLRQLGHTPPPTGFRVFLNEPREGW